MMAAPGVRERFIGGESSRRSIFGGHRNRERMIGLSVIALGGSVLTITFQLWGFIATAIAAAVVYVGTARTSVKAGSVFSRRLVSRRQGRRGTRGMDVFIPVSRRPAQLQERVRTGSRADRQRAQKEWNAYRDWPDGLVGLQWLRSDRDTPGIAWHNPVGEQSYFTVVFPLGGQVRGMESDMKLNALMEKFGRQVLAVNGSSESRQRTVQILTRILPADSAEHEKWLVAHLDRAMPAALMRSYHDLVQRMAGQYTQRHYAVGRWPADAGFSRSAARRAPGRQGWVALLDAEIDAMRRRLVDAELRPGRALSARGVAAVFRHMQMPSWPIDQAGDITDPMDCFLEEHEAWDHTVVCDRGPDGRTQEWFHRTARVPIDGVETGPRTALWMLPLLTGMSRKVIRTVSIEFETIPAPVARSNARQDLTSDLADLVKQEREGALIGDDLKVAKRSVQARVKDLEPGSGAHGGSWCMHISISAPTRRALVEATELIEEAAGECSISDLAWLDGWGQAAHATTFPVARALKANTLSSGQALLQTLGGTGRTDALR